MPTILDVLNNFKSLNLKEKVAQILQASESEIISLNQKQIFDNSEDSEQRKLSPYSSLTYALEKQRQNPIPGFGHPDLYDTGDFYRGFYVEVKSDSYLIYSRDNKVSKLVEKYGDDVFGLNDVNNEKFVNETVFPAIKSYIEGKTGLLLR